MPRIDQPDSVLFVVLFPLGIMNIAAMAAVTLVVFAEKTLPWGRPVVRVTAAALIAYGVVVLVMGSGFAATPPEWRV